MIQDFIRRKRNSRILLCYKGMTLTLHSTSFIQINACNKVKFHEKPKLRIYRITTITSHKFAKNCVFSIQMFAGSEIVVLIK